MKTKFRNLLLTTLLAMPVLFVSCEDGLIGITGQGEVVQETLNVDNFDGFVMAIAADVYVRQGEYQEVIIEAQENIIENLNLDDVRNNVWRIKNYRWVRDSEPVKIYITVPVLTKVGLSGSGEVYGETVFDKADHMEVSISGSGKVDLEVEAEDMNLSISGSGDIYLTGMSNNLDCSISGSGGIHAYNLTTGRADISVSGSGDAKVYVEEQLKVSISGSGNVYYRGDASLDSHISGSGNVRRDQ